MLEYSSIKLLKAILGSSSRIEDQFLFETFSLNLRAFSSVNLRTNALLSPSRVRVKQKKKSKNRQVIRISRLGQHHLRHFLKDYL